MPEERVTVADLLRLGATFYTMSNESLRDESVKESNRQLFTKAFESLQTPDALERFLYDRFVELGTPEALDIQQVISEVKKLAVSPKNPQGRS